MRPALPLALALAAAAPPPDLPGELRALVAKGPLSRSRAGIEVVDLATGRAVYARHAFEELNPASNSKIFTSAAALARLGPDFRWTTDVLLGAPMTGGTVQGDLYLRGRGDPTLTSERMWEIAGELWHRGLRQVEGDLVLDDSWFDDVEQGPGWEQEETDRSYLAPVSALASNWGSFAIYVSPGDRPGARARVELEPMSPYFRLENRVVTTDHRRRWIRTSGAAARGGYRVRVSGHLGVHAGTLVLWRHAGEATSYTGETFRQMLAARGIPIRGRVRRAVCPPRARLFFAAQSESLDLVLKELNKHSSNFVAEMLVKTLGAQERGPPGTWESGIDVIEEFLEKEVGIPRGTYVMRNGSGLNDVNRFSADQVVRVLAYVYPRMTLAPEFLSSLPIAARDGTIRFRMQETPAAGRVRAKTGTLDDVSALSGYVDSLDGRRYAFAILVNDYPSSLHQAIAAEDSVAEALAAGGSPAPPAAGALPDDAAARRGRAEDYAKAAERADPDDVPRLVSALGRERDPALRALAAEALWRCAPDDADAADALADDMPASPADLDRLLALAQDLALPPPLVSSLVDLAGDGNARGLRALLDLAAGEDGDSRRQAWNLALAAGLAEIAQQMPRQLLDALASGDRARALRDVRRLAAGLAENPDAAARFSGVLTEASSSASPLAGFARAVAAALAQGPEAPPPGKIVNRAIPALPAHHGG